MSSYKPSDWLRTYNYMCNLARETVLFPLNSNDRIAFSGLFNDDDPDFKHF